LDRPILSNDWIGLLVYFSVGSVDYDSGRVINNGVIKVRVAL